MRNAKSINLRFILITGLCLSFLVPLKSVQAVVPRFNITPKFTTSIRYDSNYWGLETDEQGVFTFLGQPGIKTTFDFPITKIEFGYLLDFYKYFDGKFKNQLLNRYGLGIPQLEKNPAALTRKRAEISDYVDKIKRDIVAIEGEDLTCTDFH